MNIYEAAQQAHAAGIRVIPVRADGSKAPALKSWQNYATSAEDIDSWFGGQQPRHTAYGIVTGPASGNLEMAEIEGAYAGELGQLAALAGDCGLGDLWERITHGWVEISPSGGLHWIYRVTGMDVPGNAKLAQDTDRTTIAETRGKGGQFVAAPTPGEAHPTGRPWTRVMGGPTSVPTITAEERAAFHTLLGTLDRREAPDTPASPPRSTPTGGWTGALADLEATHQQHQLDGVTPGDDYETRTSWAAILEPAGWAKAFSRGTTTYWRRPGKSTGISATTGHADDRDRLFVFSSSTEFPTFEPITKFGAYAILNHGGNHSSAAAGLKRAGYGKEQHKPLPATATDGNNVLQIPSPEQRPHLQAVRTTLALTDDSNAADLIREHGDRLRHNSDHARWLVWTGHVWSPQPAKGGSARELAKIVARGLGENSDKAIKHKRYSLSERGITAMLNMAATDDSITVRTSNLDQYPLELNTPAGIIDLATGKISPSNPDRLHTKSTRCAPDFQADPTVWQTFLEQTLPDPEIREYVQRLVGHSLLGEVRANILPFCFGPGGNGKGVFLESLMGVLGDYAGPAPDGFLMVTPYPQHPTELADLAGQRFVIASEVNAGDKFDESKVKRLTGGDTIKARFMRQDQFSFTPTHKLWLMGNDQPAVESGGEAFWRRLRLIPFTNTVPDEDKIEGLQTIMITEHGPAILAWAVAGAVKYLTDGLREPDGVKAATAAYAESSDTIGKFLEDECLLNPSLATPVSQLRAAYEAWCKDGGDRPLGGRRFTTLLQRHGIKAGRDAPRNGGTRMYGGVALVSRDEEDHPEDPYPQPQAFKN